MREVTWKDRDGKPHRSLVRDGDPDSFAPMGISFDPPDVTVALDWNEAAKELYEQLFNRGLSTWEDVQKSGNGLTAALRAVFVGRLRALYRNKEAKK